MMMNDCDKENMCLAQQKTSRFGGFAVQKPSAEQARVKSRFNSLLKDATNQIREESDNLMAVDAQCAEAVDLLTDWIQETNDYKLAQELADALEKETAAQRRLEIIQGESAALKLAVEEKRRIKAESQSKEARERSDAHFAKTLAEEEERNYFESKQRQLEDDEKYCKQLQDEVEDFLKAEEKDDDEDAFAAADSKDDAVFDFKPDVAFSGTATTSFPNDELEHKSIDDDESIEIPDTSGDRDYALNLARTEFRKEFQEEKIVKMTSLYNHHVSADDEKLICKIWDRANAEIDDVQGAVCLTILLPHIRKLRINIEQDGKTVRVETWRQVKDKRLASVDNTQYLAEFHLDGRNIQIKPDDIKYEYSGETGILFVYIEEVCLDQSTAPSTSSAPSEKKSTKIMDSIKNNFFRIFNSGSRK